MNRRYNNYKQGNQMQQRSMFLPIMICSRSSLKDVKHSHSHRRNSDDPPSPKLRFSANQSKRNNKVSGFPLNSSSSAIKPNHTETDKNIKYQKLRRLFSAKSLIDRSASTNTDSASLAKSDKAIDDCYLRNRSKYTCESRSKCGDADLELKPAKAINVEELDPPLPVIRRQLACGNGGGGEEKESLWKRRSRGGALMSLQVQSVHGGATISLHTTAAITV